MSPKLYQNQAGDSGVQKEGNGSPGYHDGYLGLPVGDGNSQAKVSRDPSIVHGQV